MPDRYFLDEYQLKSCNRNSFVQAGRGSEFDPVSYLYILRDVISALELEQQHRFLDVGCANGLTEIITSRLCKSVLAIDPVDELISVCRNNLSGIDNVSVQQGHAGMIPSGDHSFDRILMMEVFQLIPEEDIAAVFEELFRVSKSGAIILIAYIPDLAKRKEFLKSYLDNLEKSEVISEIEKLKIKERNLRARWYDRDSLCEIVSNYGHRPEVLVPGLKTANRDHRYHLKIHMG